MYDNYQDRVKLPIGPANTLIGHELCTKKCEESCGRNCRAECSNHCPPPRLDGDPHDQWDVTWERRAGAALVEILPPQSERFPILRPSIQPKEPYPATGAPQAEFQAGILCRTCAERGSFLRRELVCNHTADERAFLIDATFQELVYAVKPPPEGQGYSIRKVHEICYYTNYTTGLFDEFLGCFARAKVISDGYPKDVLDAHQAGDRQAKQAYVEKLREVTGFEDINKSDIVKSSALRSTAKLALVSVLGKQGQNSAKDSKKVCFQTSDMMRLWSSPYHEVKSYHAVTENAVVAKVEPKAELLRPYKNGCFYISAFCTARARIELIKTCKKLEQNGHAVVYCDTDSIIAAKCDPGAPEIDKLIPISEQFGAWKTEVDHIEEVIGLASKLYSYRAGGKVTTKAKGLFQVQNICDVNDREEFFLEELADFIEEQRQHKRSMDQEELKDSTMRSSTGGAVFLQPRFQISNHKLYTVNDDKATKRLKMKGPRRAYEAAIVENNYNDTDGGSNGDYSDSDDEVVLRLDRQPQYSVPLGCQLASEEDTDGRTVEAVLQEAQVDEEMPAPASQTRQAGSDGARPGLNGRSKADKARRNFPALIPTYPFGYVKPDQPQENEILGHFFK